VKKGRHRRYEEARNLKRGPELDIEALFTDLESSSSPVASDLHDDDGIDDIEADPDLYADPEAYSEDELDEYADGDAER